MIGPKLEMLRANLRRARRGEATDYPGRAKAILASHGWGGKEITCLRAPTTNWRFMRLSHAWRRRWDDREPDAYPMPRRGVVSLVRGFPE